MCILYFRVSAHFSTFRETNDSHTPDLPLQQFANCHDSSLQHSVKCLSGFQKTLPHSFSSSCSLWISGWICATIRLLMELQSRTETGRASVCVPVFRVCVSTAPLFKKLIDRRVFGFSVAPKWWAGFHGNVTGWPRSTGLGCDQCCWRDLQTAVHTHICTHTHTHTHSPKDQTIERF